MSWINPGFWSTMNVAWATNKVLKEDGVPQQERIEKIKEATGIDETIKTVKNMIPNLSQYPKWIFFTGLGLLVYIVLNSRLVKKIMK